MTDRLLFPRRGRLDTVNTACSCLLSKLCKSGIRNDACGDKKETRGLDITLKVQNSGNKNGNTANFDKNYCESSYPYKQRNKMTSLSLWLLKPGMIVDMTHSSKIDDRYINFRTNYHNYTYYTDGYAYHMIDKISRLRFFLAKKTVTRTNLTAPQIKLTQELHYRGIVWYAHLTTNFWEIHNTL